MKTIVLRRMGGLRAFLFLTAEAQRVAENKSLEAFSAPLCASAVKKYAQLNLLYHNRYFPTKTQLNKFVKRRQLNIAVTVLNT